MPSPAPQPTFSARADMQPEVPLTNLDAARRAAATNVHRATQRRRDTWHRRCSFRALALLLSIAAAQATAPRAFAEIRSPLDDASSVQQQLRTVVQQSSRSVFAVTAFLRAPAGHSLYGSALTGETLAAFAEGHARSCGSAFAIDADGHLLTNEHVVSGAASVWVTDDTGRVLPAIVIGTDPRTDLAVLAIPIATQPLSIATSQPQRGDFVVAIGNPDGLATDGNLAASVGCVSAMGRSLAGLSSREQRSYADLIQVTAPVAIGGSGGPLLDLDGYVTGIVSAAATSDRDGMPVGFAISLSMKNRKRIEMLTRGEEVTHAYFGVSVIAVESASGSAEVTGARVGHIDAATPAEGTLRKGDLIVRVADKPVATDRDFVELAAACAVDVDVPLVVRRDDETIELTVRPVRRALPAEPVTIATQRFTWAGVTFANGGHAVRVVDISSDATLPLEVGTIIRRVDGRPVPDIVSLAAVLTARRGQPLVLDVGLE